MATYLKREKRAAGGLALYKATTMFNIPCFLQLILTTLAKSHVMRLEQLSLLFVPV